MVATAMPPEPSPPLVHDGSLTPRKLAAMRVLGILPKDLEPRDRAIFPEGMHGEVRHEAFEIKRRQLANSVSGMAGDKTLDLSKSVAAVDNAGPSAGTNAFLEDVRRREEASIAKMRTRAQADVQKIVIDEMEAKKQVAIREEKNEEHRKRMVELKKIQDAKLKEQRKEALKKYEKSVEVRVRADKKLEDEAATLAAALVVKDEKVEALLREREVGWETNRVVKQADRVSKYDSIAKFKSKEWGEREKVYSIVLKRTAASEIRLGELQDELQARQARQSDRTDGVIARARSTLGAAQAEKDVAYLERLKVHDKKKEVREASAKEVAKEYATLNKKARQTFEKNYERVLVERQVVTISPRMTKSMSESYTTSPAWLTEGALKSFETHKTMGELRQLNLQHLKRSHQYSQTQALHKIEDMRHRVQALKASKDEAQYRRFDMMKNCAIEKHHLTFQIQKVRDAPPEKMNGLLEAMGMQPIKTGKEETEEDTDKK